MASWVAVSLTCLPWPIGILFSSFPFCTAECDLTARIRFFLALLCAKYLMFGSMHSWQDFSYFVLSIYHVFHLLFLSNNSRSVLKPEDFFFPTSFLSFITYLSPVLLLEKTNLRSFSSHWEKCSSVGFCHIFFWGVGGMYMQDVSTHL